MRFARKNERSSARRALLGAFLAVVVGAIGLGASSQAAVVSVDLTGFTGDNMGAANGSFAFCNAIPGVELFAANAWNNMNGVTINNGAGIGGILATGKFGSANVPINVGPGVDIGASSGDFADSLGATSFKSNFRTAPDFGPNSFLGFKTASGQYGYIEVLWTASTNTFKLVSAAYESDAGVAIQTPGGGGGAAVPEPASGAVVALLMGGTALRQWRKKRRDQETACDESLAS